jgi:hypothetical protein
LGGSNWELGYAIAVGGDGRAYVTGYTESTDYPTTLGAFDTTHNGNDDASHVHLGTTRDRPQPEYRIP